MLDLLDDKFKRGKSKKGGTRKRKRISKIFTIKQVLKHRNWIVLDIKKQLRIYDVGKWIHEHPGGADNIRKGIKANKYYVNPKKYPESPINLFKSIHHHSSGKVIQKMLIDMKNPLIKYIGIMKKV